MIENISLAAVKGPIEFMLQVQRAMGNGKYETYRTTEKDRHFLPGTELPIIDYNWVFKGAGMGDYICYMPAAVWTAKNCPWVRCRLFVGEFFVEFANNILAQAGNPNWRAYSLESMENILAMDTRASLSRGPGIIHQDGSKSVQLLNGTGGHLVDVGFAYFCNMLKPPAPAMEHPQIDFKWAPETYNGLIPKRYVVFTPGAVSDARLVEGHLWNPIIDYVVSRGWQPVFLGTSRIGDLAINKPPGCDYHKGLDLWDKTTMMDAALIMDRSIAVIGLDNGLIQLAGCTAANILAAYNIVHPDQRRPTRPYGLWYELFLSEKELACTGCQTFQKNMFPHSYNRCLYGHKNCIKILFENEGRRFIEALKVLLAWQCID